MCCMHAKSLQSCPTLCDPWTVAHQAPLSMGFSRQEHSSGCRDRLQRVFPSQAWKLHLSSLLLLQVDSLQRAPPGRASLEVQSEKTACNARDPSLLPESGRLLEEGNGEPLQYCCLGNPKDRVAWQAIWSMETQRVGHDLATKPLNLLPGKSKNNNNTFNSEIYFQLHKVHFYCK